MLVNYNKPNILTIPLMQTFDKKASIAEQTALAKNIHLTPGVNEIPKSDWDKCVKNYPKIKRLMDENLVTVEFDKDGTDSEPCLSLMEVKKALLIVKKTNNPILLEEWKASESRPGVIKEINRRLASIDKLTTPEKKQA